MLQDTLFKLGIPIINGKKNEQIIKTDLLQMIRERFVIIKV